MHDLIFHLGQVIHPFCFPFLLVKSCFGVCFVLTVVNGFDFILSNCFMDSVCWDVFAFMCIESVKNQFPFCQTFLYAYGERFLKKIPKEAAPHSRTGSDCTAAAAIPFRPISIHTHALGVTSFQNLSAAPYPISIHTPA